MRAPKRHGCIASLLGLVLLCAGIVYGVAAITAPWSFHIGGVSTPLLSWSATGMLQTKGGNYPLYVFLYPDSHFSRLRLRSQEGEDLRPTGGVQGSAWLCTSRDVAQRLKLSGTIYNGWSNTEGSVISFRLLEWYFFDSRPTRGYLDLEGRWNGTKLVMDDRGSLAKTFRSDLKIEHASVTLNPGSYSDFKAACADTAR